MRGRLTKPGLRFFAPLWLAACISGAAAAQDHLWPPSVQPTRELAVDEPDDAREESAQRASTDHQPLRLAPPNADGSPSRSTRLPGRFDPPMVTTIGSLLFVLAAFFVLAWLVRRARPESATALPTEAVEVLGRAPFQGKQQLQVIRFGHKLLLLLVNGGSVERLGEIDEPAEVDRLTAICMRDRPGSITDTFRQVLSQLGRERHRPGFLGDAGADESTQRSGSRRSNTEA